MEKIKVCDAIMGSGKSQSAITYMNEHSEEKFIYITPFLDEAARIKMACPELGFIEPNTKDSERRGSKLVHAAHLIRDGKNITTTHQSFKHYTPEMLEDIRRHEYILIIDENVDTLQTVDYNINDLNLLSGMGLLSDDGENLETTDIQYEGTVFTEVFDLLKSRRLVKLQNKNSVDLFYWMLSPDLITSFKEVFVLTYLFEAQSLYYLFRMNNIPFKYIGIEQTDTGNGYRFCNHPNYVPEYVTRIKDMIYIIDNEKLNSVGDSKHAVSINWIRKNLPERVKLKKNIYNVMRNIWKDIPKENKMWGTFKNAQHHLSGGGYTKFFLVFNSRATNEFRHKTHLAYIVNIFMNVEHKLYFESQGISVNEDMYALCTMVQWIWRSAIRDGKEIYLYLPSSRMRRILTEWMNSF